MKLVDNNLELLPWKPKQSGPGIGDAVPSNYGYRLHPNKLEFYIFNATVTPKSPSWLGAIARPLPPAGYNHMALAFDLVVDGNSSQFARCLEFDIRVSLGKFNYNCSSQINLAAGMWQVSDQHGGWTDTGLTIPSLQPWTLQHFRIEYVFDFVNKRYGTIGIAINDALKFLVPTSLQGLTPVSMNWEDSCSVQVQQDMYGVVGGYSQIMWNINLEWTA